jgi:hypothetical protein
MYRVQGYFQGQNLHGISPQFMFCSGTQSDVDARLGFYQWLTTNSAHCQMTGQQLNVLDQSETWGRKAKTVRVLIRTWWRTPLIPALRRQRQADFWVRGQPGLHSEFQDSQGYTEKPCLDPPPPKKKRARDKHIQRSTALMCLPELEATEMISAQWPCIPSFEEPLGLDVH